MHLTRTSLVAEFRLVARFNELRETLLKSATKDQLEKPLAYWALPQDRRLPLAFMGRSLHELLGTPFETLLATPGVGQKKMVALVHLLERAAGSVHGSESEFPIDHALSEMSGAVRIAESSDEFDAANVSEGAWSLWCENVKRFHLEEETLGRFATSLERLPRVLWHTPLNAYCDLTLAQIRELKTHGEKRVAAVVEVFHELHRVLSGIGAPGALAVRIQPRLVGQVENWLLAVMERSECPASEELQRHLVMPLVAQVRLDSGEMVIDLLEDRLDPEHGETSVRQRARELGLTRARIYQLLGDAAEIIAVRWPEGQYLVGHLAGKIRNLCGAKGDYEHFFAAMETLFPHRRASQLTDVALDVADEVSSQRRAG